VKNHPADLINVAGAVITGLLGGLINENQPAA